MRKQTRFSQLAIRGGEMKRLSSLSKTQKSQLEEGFRWRDRKGNFHDPSCMDTRHLYNTVKMVWNNTMPRHAMIGEPIFYKFDLALYPPKYMMEACFCMLNELDRRSDKTEEILAGLRKMQHFFHMQVEPKEPEQIEHRDLFGVVRARRV